MTRSRERQGTFAVSYQLYSSRKFPPVEAHLPVLREMGYDAVEPWPPAYKESPAALRNALDQAGLKCFGFHLPLKDLESDPKGCVDVALELGATHLIPPYIEEAERENSTEFWLEVGKILRRAQVVASRHGCRVLWHNHDFEYEALPDGSRPIDRILEGGGEDVGYEIDIGWLTRAGVSAEDEFERYGNRIHAIHVKDTASDGVIEEDGWVAAGDGIIDWNALQSHFRKTHAAYVVAEHDNPRTGGDLRSDPSDSCGESACRAEPRDAEYTAACSSASFAPEACGQTIPTAPARCRFRFTATGPIFGTKEISGCDQPFFDPPRPGLLDRSGLR